MSLVVARFLPFATYGHTTATTAPDPRPEPYAMRRGNSIHWQRALQHFQAWLIKERVPGSHGQYAFGLTDFVPAGDVEHYLREGTTLKDILNALFPDLSDAPNAQAIVTRYSVVFAILVSIGMGQHIGTFLKHDQLCDQKLPFFERPRDFPVEPSEMLQDGSDMFFKKFCATQARFCAPILELGDALEFDPDYRLPFLGKQPIGEGTSAKVYRVTVHNRHDRLEGVSQCVC